VRDLGGEDGGRDRLNADEFMEERTQPTVKERRASENRVYRVALGVSLVLHLLVLLFWRTLPLPMSPFAAAGPRAGDFRAAGGGLEAVNLQVTPPRPIVPPLVPVITLDLVDPVDFDLDSEIDVAAMMGEGAGIELAAPGVEGGRGRGDGGTAAEGLFRLVPPSPRGMIIPPTNRSLRGNSIEVWVFVNEVGKVVPDSTRLNPPTSDRGFNRRLVEEAAEWVFNPATREGQPVAAWFPYSISM
jgi:hypothetical protein